MSNNEIKIELIPEEFFQKNWWWWWNEKNKNNPTIIKKEKISKEYKEELFTFYHLFNKFLISPKRIIKSFLNKNLYNFFLYLLYLNDFTNVFSDLKDINVVFWLDISADIRELYSDIFMKKLEWKNNFVFFEHKRLWKLNELYGLLKLLKEEYNVYIVKEKENKNEIKEKIEDWFIEVDLDKKLKELWKYEKLKERTVDFYIYVMIQLRWKKILDRWKWRLKSFLLKHFEDIDIEKVLLIFDNKVKENVISENEVIKFIEYIENELINKNKKYDLKNENDINNIYLKLKNEIIGQDKAIKKILLNLYIYEKYTKKIWNNFLNIMLLWPTWVWKTETIRQLTKILFWDSKYLIQINCNELNQLFEINRIFGAPAGYVWYEDETLIDKLKKLGKWIILFDEIEKSHPVLFRRILKIIEEWVIEDNKGNKINLENFYIFYTSNLIKSIKEIENELSWENSIWFVKPSDKEFTKNDNRNDKLREKIIEKLNEFFRMPEFLWRITDFIFFNELTDEQYLEIINQKVKKLWIENIITEEDKKEILKKINIDKLWARNVITQLKNIISKKLEKDIFK